ncbi:hypothetical protein SKAU_G00186740 [Synaphobranchus kaupii]|uniref:Uncharacterized protein n=1 Tax=Synaphobranchus kaupii TaxID=118154 RepID=A0A9Q1FD55_SYNKA|nr:hypothetical protein SKAU_G00186740 [Synaphobranchus kaupii]
MLRCQSDASANNKTVLPCGERELPTMSTTLNTFSPQSPSIITDQPCPFASNHAFKEVESILTLSFAEASDLANSIGQLAATLSPFEEAFGGLATFCTLPNQWNHKLFAKNLHLSRDDTSCLSTVTQYYNRTKIRVDQIRLPH